MPAKKNGKNSRKASRRSRSADHRAQADPQPGKPKVGYGNPPTHSWFKPGQSGNPNGRPKNSPNRKTVVKQVLEKIITVREGERASRVSKLQGVIMRQTDGALKGDPRAAVTVLKLAAQHGLLETSIPQGQESELSPTEQALLSEILSAIKKSAK